MTIRLHYILVFMVRSTLNQQGYLITAPFTAEGEERALTATALLALFQAEAIRLAKQLHHVEAHPGQLMWQGMHQVNREVVPALVIEHKATTYDA